MDIIDADIQLNDAKAFSIGAVSGKYDIESVALHEAGHFAGLTHIFDCNQRMGVLNATTACWGTGVTRRTLGAGDQNGIRALNPGPGIILQASPAPEVYAIQGHYSGADPAQNLRRHVVNEESFQAYGYSWGNLLALRPDILSDTAIGNPRLNVRSDGFLLKASGLAVYAMQSGAKRHVVNEAALYACGYGFDGVYSVTDAAVGCHTNRVHDLRAPLSARDSPSGQSSSGKQW